jgi:hypothetical protein
MKTKIIIKENGLQVKVLETVVRDYDHLQAQLKNPHKVVASKKKYNRKKFKKGIDNV